MKRLIAVSVLALLLTGCGVRGFFERYFNRSGPAAPIYLVGEPYQIGGAWNYPREDYEFSETGLAKLAGGHAARTANGEVFDQMALAAGHRSLQLPAVVRVTNLENGRQMLLRLNDRGPEGPGRLIELTARAGQVLGVSNPDATRVRVEVLDAESHAAAASVQPAASAAPAPKVAAAPSAGVVSESLAPPPGAASSAGRVAAAARPVAASDRGFAALGQVDGAVRQVSVTPTYLTVEAGSFGRRDYADILRVRLARFGARLATDYNAPRDRAYFVRVGRFVTVADADAMLAQLLREGIAGARIVVEQGSEKGVP